MDITYRASSFTEENLAIALSNEQVSAESIKSRNHYWYFKKYLGKEKGIGAETILIEAPYVSKAYFSDFSNYYSTCHGDYKRHCKRLHFFSEEFDIDSLTKLILAEDSAKIEDIYLGYIVIKPLPDSLIGPTLLKTYDVKRDNKRRSYPACRDYSVSLMGKNITIRSLAYQEQDTVVAACASVAIWSALHKTSVHFQTNLPSPSEITKSAGNPFNNYGRTFPNPGLDMSQICKAIESTGLVSELIISTDFDHDVELARRIVYAYCRAGLPVLLFLNFDDNRGGHLVTINGYSESEEIPSEKKKSTSLLADRIDKFYAHDDQIGPFARMSFSGSTGIKTPWPDVDGQPKTAKIHSVIVPVYNKIRIKFQDVIDRVKLLDSIFFQLGLFLIEPEWDIYLSESNSYKSNLIKTSLDQDLKKRVIQKHYPRYVWIATLRLKGVEMFTLVYDSTDSASGYFCIDFILHEPTIKSALLDVFKYYSSEIYVADREGPRFGQDLFDKILKDLR